MGLFDRWSKAGDNAVSSSASQAARTELDATRMLEEGMSLEKQGQMDEALCRYDAAINLMPEMARAHFNRGNILLDRGDAQGALDAYEKAIEFKPDSAAAHYNLGHAHISLGNVGAAISSFQQAVSLKSDFCEAHLSLGTALLNQQQPENAIGSFDRVLELMPNHAQAHHNRGIAFQDLGQFDMAVASYGEAIAVDPMQARVHSNLGSALKELGQFDQAIASYHRALSISPSHADVYYNLGTVLQDSGKMNEAMECYRRALEIQPDHAETYNNLGVVQGELGDYEASMQSFRRAIELRPTFSAAHLNLGLRQAHAGQVDAAIACYRKALELEPDNAEAYLGMGEALRHYGSFDDAVHCFRRALDVRPDYTLAHNNLLFIQHYMPDQSAELRLAEAKRFGNLVSRNAQTYKSWTNSPIPQRRLRVGFVSGDLCDHPVGYFIEGVLAALSSQYGNRVELFGYPTRNSTDPISERIKASCNWWLCAAGLSDEALAGRIREDGIDILVDLSGHTAHNRLPMFAWKPAPVQVSWLGYFATTGVAEMDYFIADPWTLLPEQEVYFTEKVCRLPETRLCFTPPQAKVAMNELPAETNGFVTFGCFNNLSKMNGAVVELWARVLHAVPNSHLFLKTKQLGEASIQRNTSERFALHGIPANRLLFEGGDPYAGYLAAYHRVDIALDPFPYPGGATTVEALWMGVPVLTMAGKSFLSRQGVGLLANAGLHAWIAADADDYVARAAAHAHDTASLATLRASLRQQVLTSPIYDVDRFAAHFEIALRGMWKEWCTQELQTSTEK